MRTGEDGENLRRGDTTLASSGREARSARRAEVTGVRGPGDVITPALSASPGLQWRRRLLGCCGGWGVLVTPAQCRPPAEGSSPGSGPPSLSLTVRPQTWPLPRGENFSGPCPGRAASPRGRPLLAAAAGAAQLSAALGAGAGPRG